MNLSIGLSNTDRTRPIAEGHVTIDGVTPDITLMPVQKLFNLQLSEHVFDCCEFPVATYLRLLEDPEQPYLAIPIFPSRHFRLSCIFTNADSGIITPADLAGKRVGIPVFDMAAAVWLRGILQDYYGLERHAPIYVSGGLAEPRQGDEHPQFYPPAFTIEHRSDESLSELLARGEIDALYTARAPKTWADTRVRRLFDEPQQEEISYYRKSGIFPPMHVLAVKRELAEQHPELPGALYRSFTLAQEVARQEMVDSTALSTILPWQLEALFDAERVLGSGYWATGFGSNKAMLQVLIRYMLEDGLITRQFTPEELFAGPGEAEILAT